MKLYPIEVTNGANWGKFAVGRFEDEEWAWPTHVGEAGPSNIVGPLLAHTGWNPAALWVLDIQTREGAAFRHGGYAKADLEKHAIWVCPMFEPFLEWLYEQDVADLSTLPPLVHLPDAEFSLHGHRRPGPTGESLR